MKKLFTIISSFYIIALSAMPCTDMHAENHEVNITVEQSQNHHEEHNDVCPPFCHCSCCSVNAENNFSTILSNILSESNQEFNFPKDVRFDDILLAIWQPPKLS
ncbi:MAG: hypothetical protein H7Y00_13995 [Fimbriimonadaceae bacterium]|nr:hypothetical protein [Chitinophagales bacterium]